MSLCMLLLLTLVQFGQYPGELYNTWIQFSGVVGDDQL